jgi:hypothetical protein
MDQPQLSIAKRRVQNGEYLPLASLNDPLEHFAAADVYFFTRVPDIRRMELALDATLSSYKTFGPWAVRDSNPNRAICVSDIIPGLLVYRSPLNCPDLWSKSSLIKDELPTFTTLPNREDPIIDLQLIIFEDRGCALVIRHSSTDGALAHLLQTWSKAYREQNFETKARYSERQHQLAKRNDDGSSSKILNDFSIHNKSTVGNGCSIRFDVAQATLDSALQSNHLSSRTRLNTSDMLNALLWKCFSLAQHSYQEHQQIYTLRNSRKIEASCNLDHFRGDSELRRFVTASYVDICKRDLQNLATLIVQQMQSSPADSTRYDKHTHSTPRLKRKPKTDKPDSLLNEERDYRDECILTINDFRSLSNGFAFEERPARAERLLSEKLNTISIYQNDDGTITFHYVGEKIDLHNFSHHLKLLLR